jgi:acetyl-CoA synthetase
VPETAAAFLGVYKAGGVLLSMSQLYGADMVAYRLADSGARFVLVDAPHRHLVPDGAATVLVLELPGEPGEHRAGDLDLLAELARASTDRITVDTAADDPAHLYYSSGTTGPPKGILHAHRYVLGHDEYELCHDVDAGDVFCGMGEWAWAAGITPLLVPWRLGVTQLVFRRRAGFDPEEQLAVMSRNGVASAFTTPTALRSMLAVDRAGQRFPMPALRTVCSGGEPLNPEAIRWFAEQYAVTPMDYYGLTESYPLCANFPTEPIRAGSMGRVMPGWDVRLLDEDEQPVAPGERGEICLRARSNPTYPLGYWNRPQETERVFGGDWFHTGDAARQDDDGYVWFDGRADDVIISAGYRIGPFEVESACLEHPAVREAAAVAAPDERRGHVVKAYIVLDPAHPGDDALAADIARHVREQHSAYAYPRQIEFVAELPKTVTGKIQRARLREASATVTNRT